MAQGEASFVEFPIDPDRLVVLSAPHAGRIYPDEVLRAAAVHVAALRVLEDGATDRLAGPAAADGSGLLVARFARAFVDLNRATSEIDAALFGDDPVLHALEATAKVQAGLGVIPSRLGAMPIWRAPLGAAVVAQRLRHAWHPYHRRLETMLEGCVARHGRAVLLDLHSMPGEAMPGGREARVDIALGDRWGATADAGLVDRAHAVLGRAGFVVGRNSPYAGGYITAHYGRPAAGRHAIQLEVRRDLFLDPRTLEPHDGVVALARTVAELARELDRFARDLPPAGAAPSEAVPPAAGRTESLRAAD